MASAARPADHSQESLRTPKAPKISFSPPEKTTLVECVFGPQVVKHPINGVDMRQFRSRTDGTAQPFAVLTRKLGIYQGPNFIWRSIPIGVGASAPLVFSVGGMSVFTKLTGAEGTLVVDSNIETIQHYTGGIVAEILVRDGDTVRTGDILVELDDTQTKANLPIITKSQDELAANEAGDLAERDDKDTVHFPQGLLDRIDDPQVAEAVAGERRLFEIRKGARDGQKAQLTERISQLSEHTTGLDTQQASRASHIDWINEELEGVRGLWDQKLVAHTRLTSLEREGSRLDGERGQLISQIAETKGKIAETKLQIIQVDQDMRSEIGKDLADIRAKQVEFSEKRIAAQDQMNRIDIRAPQDGVVHQSSVHTVGGVINPGKQLMLVVPERGFDRRNPGLTPRHRPDLGRPESQPEVHHLEAAHHPRAQWRCSPAIRGHPPGPEDPMRPTTPSAFRRRAQEAGRPEANGRHAGRGLHHHQRTLDGVLPGAAGARSAGPSVRRKVTKPETTHEQAAPLLIFPSVDDRAGLEPAIRPFEPACSDVKKIVKMSMISVSEGHRIVLGAKTPKSNRS
jgi:HlyD family secretion protein